MKVNTVHCVYLTGKVKLICMDMPLHVCAECNILIVYSFSRPIAFGMVTTINDKFCTHSTRPL